MSNEHRMAKTRSGSVLQSGIPKRGLPNQPTRARGLALKGVVTAVYVLDDPNHPAAQFGAKAPPVAVYCDVLSYTNISGMRWRYIPRCLVVHPVGSGMHRGQVWKPRATTLDVTDVALDANKASNPANFDGDHVVVKFLNDNLNEPYIDAVLPHPIGDAGNESRNPGNRLRLKLADGDPNFWKHHGSYFGVDDNGDYVVDTSFANDGTLDKSGLEAAPPTDGKGSQRFRLAQDSDHEVTLLDMTDPAAPVVVARMALDKLTWEIKFTEGATLKAENKDANAVFTVGDGAVSAVIYETLKTFWDTVVKPLFDAHIHPTGVGPSGATPTAFPSFDTAIKSSKLKFPDL